MSINKYISVSKQTLIMKNVQTKNNNLKSNYKAYITHQGRNQYDEMKIITLKSKHNSKLAQQPQ